MTGQLPDEPLPPDASDDFLSGTSGQVWGKRSTSRALVTDALLDASALARLEPWRLPLAARAAPRRRVLALGIERSDMPNLLSHARSELLRSHHDVDFAGTVAGSRGKFENLNALLAGRPAAGHDWLVVIDDDVVLPAGFLDAFIFLAERFDLTIAQPAHRRRSHAAWAVTRRQFRSVVRETAFVEIGPVFAFQARAFDTLLPFPPLRVGWGLDAHWSAVARDSRLAARRDRRDADPSRPEADRRLLRPRRGGRRGARFSGPPDVRPGRRGPAHAGHTSLLASRVTGAP